MFVKLLKRITWKANEVGKYARVIGSWKKF